MILRRQQRTM